MLDIIHIIRLYNCTIFKTEFEAKLIRTTHKTYLKDNYF